jgi:hypothetical protein
MDGFDGWHGGTSCSLLGRGSGMEATPAGGRPGQTGEMKRAEATIVSGNQDLAVTTDKQTADRHRTWSNGVHSSLDS